MMYFNTIVGWTRLNAAAVPVELMDTLIPVEAVAVLRGDPPKQSFAKVPPAPKLPLPPTA